MKETPSPFPLPDVAILRKALFEAKLKKRHGLRQASIIEKLRVLEEMRDFTAALRGHREANKARVRSAWARK
ncbi:MAG: hypothetical protein WDO13_09485 [Verrucomicrobiota bacterium]